MRFLALLVISALPLSAAVPPHPRLFFPPARVEEMKSAIRRDDLARTMHERVLKTADSMISQRTVRYEIPDGKRLLSESRLAIRQVTYTAYAWRMTRDRKYFDRCVQELDAACELKDWNPSHFLDVGEMATAVALGYDWLYPDLSPDQRARYEASLLRKGIGSLPAKAPGWWKGPTNNWTQVCNGGMMLAADAIREINPDVANPILEHTRRVIGECVKFYQPDGAYPEGPAYWHYGTSYQVLGMALIDRDTPRTPDPIWRKTSHFLVHATGPGGIPFNFADSNPGVGETSPAQTWLVGRTGDALSIEMVRSLLAARYSRNSGPTDRFLPLTLLWLPAAPKNPPPPPLAATFQGEQSLAFFRTSWQTDALWLGIKGGTPAASHGHMDVGSFVLDWAGSRWIHDLGSENYNFPGYFGDKRFTYYRLQNYSHNTLVIGGKLQNPKAKPCPLTPLETRDGRASTTIDLTDAYSGQCEKAVRTVEFDTRKKAFALTDQVKAPSGAVRWQAVTDAKVTLRGDAVLLEKGDSKILLRCMTPSLIWKVEEAKAPTDQEKKNPGMQVVSIEAPAAPQVTLRIEAEAR